MPTKEMSEAEYLRETDYLAYVYVELYTGEENKDTPEDNEYHNNMLDVLEKHIDPKYNRRDILTLFEDAKAAYQQTCEARGFKRGVEFASRFFDAVKHPYCMDSIEAYRKYEWMKKSVRVINEDSVEDGKDKDGE